MPRNRMIKTTFWDDEKMSMISREARLTYIGMWNFSDDFGVIKGHPAYICKSLFPYDKDVDTDSMLGWVKELMKIGRIFPFSHKGESYYYIPTFLVHQKINNPSSRIYPEPPPDILKGNTDSCEDPTVPLHEDYSRTTVGLREGSRLKEKDKENVKENNIYSSEQRSRPDGLTSDNSNKEGKECNTAVQNDSQTPDADSSTIDSLPITPLIEKRQDELDANTHRRTLAMRTPILTIPLISKNGNGLPKEHPIYQEDIDEWQDTYSNVLVASEIKHIRDWNKSNPKKRKTEKGIRKHISAWLKKAHEKGASQKKTVRIEFTDEQIKKVGEKKRREDERRTNGTI